MDTTETNQPEPTGLFKVVISYLEPQTQLMHVKGWNQDQVAKMIIDTFGHMVNFEIENIELIDGEEQRDGNVVDFPVPVNDDEPSLH